MPKTQIKMQDFLSRRSRNNPTRNHEVEGSNPGLAQCVKDLTLRWAVVYVGHRRDSNLMLLWLWWRHLAIAPIWPLAWEPQYAEGSVLEREKKNKSKCKNHLFFLSSSFFFFFFLLRAVPMACGSSQVRSWIRAAAASHCHNHNDVGSEPSLPPTPQLRAMPDT